MQSVSTILVYLAFAGALVSWGAGAVLYLRALSAAGDGSLIKRLAVPVWPFAVGYVTGTGAPASRVNKALVALIACLLVGVAAFSASANLHRYAK